MDISERTMQEIVGVMNTEIGPTFKIDDLVQVLTTARDRCEADRLAESDIPGVFKEELRKFKAEHKLFGLGRFSYAFLFERPGAPVGAEGL